MKAGEFAPCSCVQPLAEVSGVVTVKEVYTYCFELGIASTFWEVDISNIGGVKVVSNCCSYDFVRSFEELIPADKGISDAGTIEKQ